MITLTILSVCFAIMLIIAAGGLVVAGAIFAGTLLIAVDVIIGMSPFIGLVMLIKWLCTDKEKEEKKKLDSKA